MLCNFLLTLKYKIPTLKKLQYFSALFILLFSFFNLSAQTGPVFDSLNQVNPNCGFGTNSGTITTETLPSTVYPSAVENCGRFRIVYGDLNDNAGAGNGQGFDHPVLGAQRRSCFCNVLTYIQNTIDFHPTITSTNQITIYIQPSVFTGSFLAGAAIDNSNATTPGFHHTGLADLIINGNSNIPTNQDFGEIVVNFSHDYSYCNTPGPCDYNFFALMLHEMTHLMGFASAIISDGTNVTSSIDPINNDIFYEYDRQFLYFDNSGTMQKLVNNSTATLNPVATNANLTSNRIWMHNTNLVNDKTNQPCYAQSTFAPGTSLSHLNSFYPICAHQSPGYTPAYIMDPGLIKGDNRNNYSNEELRLLQQLGFTINNSAVPATTIANRPPRVNGNVIYGPIYNPVVGTWAFWRDRAPVGGNNSLNITTDNCNNVIVDLTNLTITGFDPFLSQVTTHSLGIDDPDNDAISVYNGQLLNVKGCGNGGNNHNQLSINLTNDIITFTPRQDFYGMAQFAFHLFDGTERGSYVLISIDVAQNMNCFDNNCELVLNGDFEEGMEYDMWTGTNYDFRTRVDETSMRGHLGQKAEIDGLEAIGGGWEDNPFEMHVKGSCTGTTEALNSIPPVSNAPGTIGNPDYHPSILQNGSRYYSSSGGGSDFESNSVALASEMVPNAEYNLQYDYFITIQGPPYVTPTNFPNFLEVKFLFIDDSDYKVFNNSLDFNYNNAFNPNAFIDNFSPSTGWQQRNTSFIYSGNAGNRYMKIQANPAYIQRINSDNFSLQRVFNLTFTQPNPCNPNTLTINNLTLGGGSFQYSLNNGPLQSANTFTISTPGNHIVTVTDGTSCQDFPVNVVFGQLFTSNISFVNCTLFATPLGLPSSNYAWTDGTLNWTGNSLTPPTSGTYTVTVTDATNSCTASSTITVNPNPTINYTSNPTTPITVCDGDPVILSGSGGISYQWSGGVINAAPFYPSTSGTYTVTGTDAFGCTGTANALVNVLPVPSVNIASSNNPSPICFGQSSTLDAIPNNSNWNYLWQPGAQSGSSITVSPGVTTSYAVTVTDQGNLCTSTSNFNLVVIPPFTASISQSGCDLVASPNHPNVSWTDGFFTWLGNPFTPPATGTYTVTITDQNGCSSTASYNFSLPSVTASTPTTLPTCANDPVSLIATPATYNSYSWSPGSLAGPTVTDNPPVTTNYTVTASDAFGCTATSTLQVTVNPLPILAPTANPNPLCLGDQLNLNSNLTSSSPPFNYSWFSTSNPFIGNTPNITPVTPAPTVNDTYTIAVTDGNGCLNSATVFVPVNPSPTVTATQVGCDLVATASGGTPPYFSYQWAGPNPGSGTPYTPGPNGNGTYIVTVTDANGCTATSTINFSANAISCCAPSYPNHIFNDQPTLASSIYSYFSATNGSALTQNFAIEGTLIVDVPTWFANNNVKMGEDAEIVVSTGIEFKCTDGAILEGICDRMWKGITVTQNNSLATLTGGSRFLDMIQGVLVENNGKLDATGCHFHDNLNSIYLKNLSQSYAGIIQGNFFETVKPNLWAPHTNLTRGHHGITIVDCERIVIGEYSSNGWQLKNHFENLSNGINIYNSLSTSGQGYSEINTSYNTFKNISGGQLPWMVAVYPNTFNEDWRGSAIYTMNTVQNYRLNLIHSGGRYDNPTVIDFKECDEAVLTNATETVFRKNVVADCNTGCLNYRTSGIRYTIMQNKIDNTYWGFNLSGDTYYGYVAYNDIEQIKANLTPPSFPFPSSYLGFYGRGISSHFYNSSGLGPHVYLRENNITSTEEKGILGIVMTRIPQNSTIEANQIHFTSLSSNTDTYDEPSLRGITLAVSNGATIMGNEVHGLNSANFLNNRYTAGLYLHRSVANYTACNIFNNLQYGEYVVGDCSDGTYDKVNGNNFNTARSGILYRQLGVQGMLGNIGAASIYDANNQFYGTNTFANLYKMGCGSGGNENLFTVYPAVTSSSNGGCDVILPFAAPYAETFTHCGNAVFDPPPPMNGVTDMGDAGDIAGDNKTYAEFPTGMERIDERDLYEDLDNDPSARQANPLLNQFYTQHQSTAMAYLYETDLAISAIFDSISMANPALYAQNLQQAISLNNMVVSNEPFELQERSMNEKYFKVIQAQSLSQAEWTEIEQLAKKCPYIDGYGVYKARQLYTMIAPGAHFDDLPICNNVGYYKSENSRYNMENSLLKNGSPEVKKWANNNVKVYPNPAYSYVAVELDYDKDSAYLFELYDMAGRKILSSHLLGRRTILDIQQKAVLGVYTYKVMKNSLLHTTGKLIIE